MTIEPIQRLFIEALLVTAIAALGSGCAEEDAEATSEDAFVIGDAAQCEAVEDRLVVQAPLEGEALEVCREEPQGTPVFDPDSGTIICGGGSLPFFVPVASTTDQSAFFAQYTAFFFMPPSPGEERLAVAVGLHPLGERWGTGCSSRGSFSEAPSGSKVAPSLAGLELCVDDDRIVLDPEGNTDNLYVKQGDVYCPIPLHEL